MYICDSLMPCDDWASVDDLCLKCGQTVDAEDIPVYERWLKAAVSYVFVRTARIYTGCCDYVILPCKKKCCSNKGRCSAMGSGNFPFVPVLGNDGIYNSCCVTSCCDFDDCSCTFGDKIRLPSSNVVSVTEIVIDGVVLDAAKYKLKYDERGAYVRRVDGVKFPECQDLNKNLGEEGSWHIRYKAGVAPPAYLVEATMLFAVELAKQCLGKPCQLPKRYSTIEGSPVLDVASFVEKGYTGFMPLDIILATLNPTRLRSPVRMKRVVKRGG